MRFLVLFFVGLLTHTATFGQAKADSLTNHYVETLNLPPSGKQGAITIKQDSLVGWLLNKYEAINAAENKMNGWRIQIYNSSGKVARDEANDIRNKFLNVYSNHKAYLIYQPPFFKIRVGDFRTKQDAFELYKSVMAVFPVSYIVNDKVNLPSID